MRWSCQNYLTVESGDRLFRLLMLLLGVRTLGCFRPFETGDNSETELKYPDDERDNPEMAESDFVKLRFVDCLARCLHSSPHPRCLGTSAIGRRGVRGRSGSSSIVDDGALGSGFVLRLSL
jgi:hypothetical protein